MIKLCVFSDIEFAQRIMKAVKDLNGRYERICYVSLNKPSNAVIRILKEQGVKIDKFFFVEPISMSAAKDFEKFSNCCYISSPNALTELSVAISSECDKRRFDVILFDSL